MANPGDFVTFRIELAENGFIGAVCDQGDTWSDQFVATNIGSLWLAAKEKVKVLLEIEEK